MAEHIYEPVGRRFFIVTRGTPAINGPTAYTVERVGEGDELLVIEGLESIVSSSEDAAAARARDLIDQMIAFERTYDALAKSWAEYQRFSKTQEQTTFEAFRKRHSALLQVLGDEPACQGLTQTVNDIAEYRTSHQDPATMDGRTLESAWAQFESVGAAVSEKGRRFRTAFRRLARTVVGSVPPGIVFPPD